MKREQRKNEKGGWKNQREQRAEGENMKGAGSKDQSLING